MNNYPACRVKTTSFLLDCGVTEWSVWSPCSQFCGDGIRRRTRQVNTNKVNCSEIINEEMEPCHMPPCGKIIR